MFFFLSQKKKNEAQESRLNQHVYVCSIFVSRAKKDGCFHTFTLQDDKETKVTREEEIKTVKLSELQRESQREHGKFPWFSFLRWEWRRMLKIPLRTGMYTIPVTFLSHVISQCPPEAQWGHRSVRTRAKHKGYDITRAVRFKSQRDRGENKNTYFMLINYYKRVAENTTNKEITLFTWVNKTLKIRNLNHNPTVYLFESKLT